MVYPNDSVMVQNLCLNFGTIWHTQIILIVVKFAFLWYDTAYGNDSYNVIIVMCTCLDCPVDSYVYLNCPSDSFAHAMCHEDGLSLHVCKYRNKLASSNLNAPECTSVRLTKHINRYIQNKVNYLNKQLKQYSPSFPKFYPGLEH